MNKGVIAALAVVVVGAVAFMLTVEPPKKEEVKAEADAKQLTIAVPSFLRRSALIANWSISPLPV